MPVASITQLWQIDSPADDRPYPSINKVMTGESDRLCLCVAPSCSSQVKNGVGLPWDKEKPLCFCLFWVGIWRNSVYVWRMKDICLKGWKDGLAADIDGVFQSTRLCDSMKFTTVSDIVLICLYLLHPHSWWLETLLPFCGSLLLHYLNLIVIITCSASLMIAGLATALIDAQQLYKSSEVIDIVSNVVRNNWAGWWCVRSPLNLNEASVYK